ncbi:MAG: L,D-transpeptidase family protein [Sedimentisphaerales bacterium]|nr:L,D-transpeptidase family protein [Sedimentisphaerales bacterium]
MARTFMGILSRYRLWLYAGALVVMAATVVAVVYLVPRPVPRRPVVPAAAQTQVPTERPAEASVPQRPTESVQQVQGPSNAASSVEATASSASSVEAAVAKAMASLAANPMRLVEVRDRLNAMLAGPLTNEQERLVKAKLSELATKWLFGPDIYPSDRLCQSYLVQPGDQLRVIGQRCKVPYELLMSINRIPRPEALRAGQYIKIVNGPFHAKVSRSNFTVDIYLQDTYVCTYPVGLGRPGYETPKGLWVVKPGGKLIKPQWTDPDTGRTYRPEDPDYPLGSRWIGLEGIEGEAVGREGFAIHGTNDPNQIGQQGSRGCIRLHNGDAVAVYNMLMPGQSKVRVTD